MTSKSKRDKEHNQKLNQAFRDAFDAPAHTGPMIETAARASLFPSLRLPVNARLLAALRVIVLAWDGEPNEAMLAGALDWPMQNARAVLASASFEAEKAEPVVIRLDIDHGVVGDPVGLPPGVHLHVHDIDRDHYEGTEPCAEHPEGGCCVHEFHGE